MQLALYVRQLQRSQWGGSFNGWRLFFIHFDGWRLNFRALDGWRLLVGNLVQEFGKY